MSNVMPHPANPVAKDQKFLTCGGCKHSDHWQGAIGKCMHAEHVHWSVGGLSGKTIKGKLHIGVDQGWVQSGSPDAQFQITDGGEGNSSPMYPVVTDLQCCSKWEETP